MFFLFHGTDTNKARATALKNIEAAKKKHQGAEFFRLNSDNFSEAKLDELIASQGLFYSASIVLADRLCDEEERAEIVLKKLKDISTSPSFFVFLEAKLNKKELEKFTKYATKVEEFTKPEKILNKKEKLAAKGEKIDFFEFADALGEKNKRQLWALYQDALRESVASEEVHAILFWQVKSMLSAARSSDADQAGLNPFVYGKAKAFAKNYGVAKLKEMSAELFHMYHRAHRGEIDFAVALEKFILKI